MKKGIWLSLGALLLVGVIAFAIWYINEEGKMRTGSKDAFIPYNSAVVISVNGEVSLKPEVRQAFAEGWKHFRRRLLSRVTDTLRAQGYVKVNPYVIAARLEGKSDLALLYVMDNMDVLSRSEVAGFLNQVYAGGAENMRKYDRYKIYTLKEGKEEVYFSVCGGIILVSDSELYIEDGLKQFDREEEGEAVHTRYQNLNKYFSAGAGMNVFLNTGLFTEVLPLYLQVKKIFPHVDVARFFEWGAIDADFRQEGICLNGFLYYGGMKQSFMRVLEKQEPKESNVDAIIPSRLMALGMLNIADLSSYFAALEAYRYDTEKKEIVYRRKQQYDKMFGKGVEEEWRNLLQGEFALADLAFDGATQEKDGLLIVALKSGSLGRMLLERMLTAYARFDGRTLEEYKREYRIDREKAFGYFQFPAEDFASVYWGYILEGIKNRFVFVEDNYLVFASSEKAVKKFVQDYVHRSFIRDAEWYCNLKTKLAGKYNIAYFAKTAEILPVFENMLQADRKVPFTRKTEAMEVFPYFALQWSNEGEFLYNTLFLSTEEVEEDLHPHVLWQTKLDAPLRMKPVPVLNHVTRERELFVQDEGNTIYLINDAGRILWKLALEEQINSDVWQVDLFKNGKLQYLFSTLSRMHLIDRNGNHAGHFPVTFRAKCEQGISVFDYDGRKEYRIFAPGEDRKVYLYGLDGKLVQGWNPAKADKKIVSKVEHFRVHDKDYIVFADLYRLYILDRKGKERVKVSSVFELDEHTDVYKIYHNAVPRLSFLGKGGKVYQVDFEGRTTEFKMEGFGEGGWMNVADLKGDGDSEYIFSNGNRIFIADGNGKVILNKELEANGLDFPYIYRFSGRDSRIGLMDRVGGKMLLLAVDGNVSKGFPLAGDSPFSIVFSGNDGFFLFAGADNGSVIKYKVQR